MFALEHANICKTYVSVTIVSSLTRNLPFAYLNLTQYPQMHDSEVTRSDSLFGSQMVRYIV